MTHTASWLELGWSTWCFVGACVAAWLCRDLWEDSREVRKSGTNGIRQATTRLSLCIAGVFVLALAVFVLIGVVAMTQPPPQRLVGCAALGNGHVDCVDAVGSRVPIGQVAATIGFCGVAVAVDAVCVYWRIVRAHYLRGERPL